MVTKTITPASPPIETRPSSPPRTAEDVMTTDVLFVDEDLTLTELADFLVDHRISGAVVRNASGQPIGVVSLSDLAATRNAPSFATPSPRSFYDLAWDLDEQDVVTIVPPDDEARAGDIMTPEAISVERDASISEVARTMLDGLLHRVLVRDDSGFVGIVTSSDLLRVLATSD